MKENKLLAQEIVIRAAGEPEGELAPGVALRILASERCGAEGFCTAFAKLAPLAVLPYHFHEYSEAITVVSGIASVAVEGRTYLLQPLDCIHVPKLLAHSTANTSKVEGLTLLTAFASASPTRRFVKGDEFHTNNFGLNDPQPTVPEHIRRFTQVEKYELADGTQFCDLFAGRFGAVGICGGYGLFAPGTSLPCHVHDFGESITIITGTACCQVMGKEYSVSGCDTAFIPRGRPHRFLNESGEMMAMIWVYAGDEPTRTLIETSCCESGQPRSGRPNDH